MKKPFVYVALDYDSFEENLAFARELVTNVRSQDYGFKINLDGVLNFDPSSLNAHSIVSKFSGFGRKLFVDLKMWNGGRTMENIAKGCAQLDVDIINAYPQAGAKFIARIKEALSNSPTRLFTLTILTHYTEDDTRRIYNRDLSETVKFFAEIGISYGADGIILPGTQLGVVKHLDKEKLVPAIRPVWYEDRRANEQEQTVTPSEAIQGGANILVVGSPIRKSKNRIEALEKILDEMGR